MRVGRAEYCEARQEPRFSASLSVRHPLLEMTRMQLTHATNTYLQQGTLQAFHRPECAQAARRVLKALAPMTLIEHVPTA